MTVLRRVGSPYWFIEFRYLGQIVRRTSGTTSKAKANELEQLWRREIHDRVKAGKAPTISLGEAIDNYYETKLLPRGGDPATRKKDLYTLNKLRKHFGADTPLDQLPKAKIAAYRDQLVQKDGLGHAATNRELGYLRAILKKAADDGIAASPFDIKLFKEPPGRVRYLEPDEEKRLLAECADHVRPIITFQMDTGCRLGEARKLTWRQVFFLPRGQVRVAIAADQTKQRRGVGKLLPRRSARMLKAMHKRAKSPLVFVNADGQPIGSIRTAFNAACRRAGIADFRIHDLRHHYASKLAKQDVTIQKIAKLLGHKSTRMAERYAHLSPTDLDSAVSALN